MKAIYSIVLGLMLAIFTSQASADSSVIPSELKYDGKTMVLNGSGVRKKFFMRLYVGSLYLTAKSTDGDAISAADEPMAIRLWVTNSRVTQEKMKQAIVAGLNTATNGDLASIQTELDQVLGVFDKGVAIKDVFEIINVVGSGLHIVKNGEKMLVVNSLPFKQALFRMWLSKTPVDARLRRGMLGL